VFGEIQPPSSSAIEVTILKVDAGAKASTARFCSGRWVPSSRMPATAEGSIGRLANTFWS
jgi:hypothetical protein